MRIDTIFLVEQFLHGDAPGPYKHVLAIGPNIWVFEDFDEVADDVGKAVGDAFVRDPESAIDVASNEGVFGVILGDGKTLKIDYFTRGVSPEHSNALSKTLKNLGLTKIELNKKVYGVDSNSNSWYTVEKEMKNGSSSPDILMYPTTYERAKKILKSGMKSSIGTVMYRNMGTAIQRAFKKLARGQYFDMPVVLEIKVANPDSIQLDYGVEDSIKKLNNRGHKATVSGDTVLYDGNVYPANVVKMWYSPTAAKLLKELKKSGEYGEDGEIERAFMQDISLDKLVAADPSEFINK